MFFYIIIKHYYNIVRREVEKRLESKNKLHVLKWTFGSAPQTSTQPNGPLHLD